MHEATKLIPDDVPVSHEPDLGLSEAAAPRTAHAVTVPRPHSFARRATTVTLILFLLGLLAFAAGGAVAWAITTGMLDTPWMKDTMHALKELLHHAPTPK